MPSRVVITILPRTFRQIRPLGEHQQRILVRQLMKIPNDLIQRRLIKTPATFNVDEAGQLHDPSRTGNMTDDIFQDKFRWVLIALRTNNAMINTGPHEIPIGSGAMIHHQDGGFPGEDGVPRNLYFTFAERLQKSLQ